MSNQIEALLVTKGHAFDRETFFQMIDALKQYDNTYVHWTHVEHPAAGAVLTPENASIYDVIVFYDMPGVTFTNNTPPFSVYEPTEKYKENFLALLDLGIPMIFLHHAIASWPTWDEFAEIVGGRFHFLPGNLRGKHYPGSGYRFRVEQNISVMDTNHPITKGLPANFPIRDEAYLMPVFEEDVKPLLRSDFKFEAANFRYGGVNFKSHDTGSNLVGWTKNYKNSPIIYLQFGHEDIAYSNKYYRKLLNNAINWAATQSKVDAFKSQQKRFFL